MVRPTLVMLMGYPGSGKSYTASQLASLLGMAHLSSDKVREKLFPKPSYTPTEHRTVVQIMLLMAEQFLEIEESVVFDISLNRLSERKAMREMTKKRGATPFLLWLQIDRESAKARAQTKDKRRTEDKYTAKLSDAVFNSFVMAFQPPQNEDYLVVSGKHTFNSQKGSILRKMREMGLIEDETLRSHVPKPELMNLAAKARAEAGLADYTKRNITVR